MAKGNTPYDYDYRRLTTMVDGVGTTAYRYGAMGLLASETGPRASEMVSDNNLGNGLRGGFAYKRPTRRRGRSTTLTMPPTD